MQVKSPHVIWASVLIVAIITASSLVLALNDKDPEVIKDTIINAAIPLLALFGVGLYQKLGKVEETTNGKNEKLMDIIKEKDDKIAGLSREIQEMALRVLPPIPPLPPEEK